MDFPNGHSQHIGSPTIEELEGDLPVVYDGQVSLGDLLTRVVQTIYGELSELAETMPNMSDPARKRTLADWVVKTKKQVVKLYAAVKWSRDADTVQKCMNITAFLMNQNQQFEDCIVGLHYAKDSLDPSRLRNHDLLTSLDVLTTGSYHGLPTIIKKLVVPPSPLTDAEVLKTLAQMEEVLWYRLRLQEVIPIEMSNYRIANGRVYFTIPRLFETSLCLRGALKDDGWFFVHVEFLITVGGDLTGLQGTFYYQFPRIPPPYMKRHITDEADAQLAYYLPLPDQIPPPIATPPRPKLPEGVVDAPLVRVFNFLQMMSLSYQLEILWYQAERMRSLGWGEFLTVSMSDDRKSLSVSYWIRPVPAASNSRPRTKIPPIGGTLTISITEIKPSRSQGPARSPTAEVLCQLQQQSKIGSLRPSDEVESLHFHVRWEPALGALGVNISPNVPEGHLTIDASHLDFESLLNRVLRQHTHEILSHFKLLLQHGHRHSIFSAPGVVEIAVHEQNEVLRVNLCADAVVLISLDSRSGRLGIRDTSDLASPEKEPHFKYLSAIINEEPPLLFGHLLRLRYQTITDLVMQKAVYLGLQCFKRRNFITNELGKLGPTTRGAVFVKLANFPTHYLVLVIDDIDFRYALISTEVELDSPFSNLLMRDVAWLDIDRLRGQPRISNASDAGFNLDVQLLRELYDYCCARVAYMKVESQFKSLGIKADYVDLAPQDPLIPGLDHVQSSLARSVPGLLVKADEILSGAPAAEAAMPNIRVIALNWWSNTRSAQVITCVKLKYVQQPVGKSATSSSIIRFSKRIIYDTTTAVVSFVSEDVNTCVPEFLEEWARVSKMVVIAREVARMSKEKMWSDVRLLSFDLQTVSFAYASDYIVAISCEDQVSTGGKFDLRFSRCGPAAEMTNPHDSAEPFLSNILRAGQGTLAPSLHRLITCLRETLPIAIGLAEIQEKSQGKVDTFAKSAGWYRLLFVDARHALDFRLMSHHRIAILDGSHSVYGVPSSAPEDKTLSLCLQPIPRIETLILNALRTLDSSASHGKVVLLSYGVICETQLVRTLGQAIYTAISETIK
ncbi:Mediator of RNA polymerase II transcription subunit 14 [Mycena indigotica]|uniref:Mediator of RNA polymerase II transcription subunit 14 n=1 Tax=Mycena indigotica TaxID=2126181 RepID=A0A8H6WHN6_9AGAR|nr:Mediator of RNA polymerase II transcription subunit 14 [Mycena indigotica]KAF7315273.1 Mediator of RNA polymerase II transcription subunit 14 [Mycena indigotica]